MKAGSNRSAAQKVIPHHFRTMAIPSLITPAISSMRMKALINWSIPYRSIVSSVQWYGDELIVNSGMRTEFYVYDTDGQLLASYAYNDMDESIFLGYRIYKYSFNDFWFA